MPQTIQHRGDIGHGPVRSKFQQPSAYVQAAGFQDTSILNQGPIAGAAANIEVEHRFPCSLGVVHCSGPLGGQDTLQIRPCRSNHEFPGEVRKSVQHRPGIFLPGSLPCDNDGPGVDIRATDACLFIFGGYDIPDRRPIHMGIIQQGRKLDGAFIENLPVRDLHFGNGKAGSPVVDVKLRDNQLGSRRPYIQAHRPQPLRHGPSPPPAPAGP